MSVFENGMLVNIDNTTKSLQAAIDKNIENFEKDVTISDCSNGYNKACNGRKNAEVSQQSLDIDQELEDTSPDISLSSQKTLRYCDVEDQAKGRVHSVSSTSDSNDALNDYVQKDHNSKTDEENHFLANNISREDAGSPNNTKPQKNNIESSDTDTLAKDCNEVIPELTNATPRPESLSLSKLNQDIEQDQSKSSSNTKRHKQNKNVETDKKFKESSKTEQLMNSEDQDTQCLDSDVCLAQNLPQGTITRKGDMIQFVADDLMEKIKKSSPMSQTDTASNGSRRSSVRSIASASSSTSFATSSGVSRSPSSLFQQSPDDIPLIDATAVMELENHARRVADSIDLMMGNIQNNLHKMSAITIGCEDAYKRSVDITCDSVDASIKSMYTLMAKCEELSRSMKPVEQLAVQIREIKRILDLFEAQMTDK